MSVVQITGSNGPKLFRESLYKMRSFGAAGNSRNGEVLSIESPVVLRLLDPTHRVLTDPNRDANPFFHAMEFVWMMAGSNDIQWIAQFNKNMLKFSDDDVTQHGAYGYRWRKYFGLDQIKKVINLIRKNPDDRRLVINMWNPPADLGYTGADVPCNTQLLFRVVEGELQMTVINRSNDLIWGALGANLCHMTMLQELIANAVGMPVGTYYVFTQNLHIYSSVPNFNYYIEGIIEDRDIYNLEVTTQIPMLVEGEGYAEFVEDCERLVQYGATFEPRTQWMRTVGMPIYIAWKSREEKDLDVIIADDWRISCTEWVERRKRAAVGNQQRDNYTGHARREQESKGVGGGSGEPSIMASLDSAQPDVGSSAFESSPNDTLPSQPL